MQIWVDADACPAVIKDILYRAAERTKIPLTLVANRLLRTPASPFIRALQVPHGIDVADSHIVRECSPGAWVVWAFTRSSFKAMPSVRLLAVDEAGERPLGDCTFLHSAT